MSKNIVLCADGTGNKGGYTPDSNVYKMYIAVDKHDPANPQMTYYDNGVGTEQNKILRTLGGAMGLGFGSNVKDLYKYLARKYEPESSLPGKIAPADKVFLFGFSRGAATIRAFSGFVHTCGLIDGRGLSNDEMTRRVDAEFDKYIKWRRNPELAKPVKEEGLSHGVIDIEFMGVWDTVSALGFPERTDITSVGMWALNWVLTGLDHLTDKFHYFAHRFYNYELTDNVKYAYQALALDDERTAFWPWVWDEHGRAKNTVEQVWFAGMHSNVGGGYNRSGMAKVALDWMMERCSRHGLMLREDKMREISAEAHVDGRMYDSRDGLAMFYRFHPRELEKLCHRGKICCQKKECDENKIFALSSSDLEKNPQAQPSCNKLLGEIKVHDSVVERMKNRTANYAPTQLPETFEIAKTDLQSECRIVQPKLDKNWAAQQVLVKKWIFLRKWLYGIMLESTLAIVAIALYFWINPPTRIDGDLVSGLMQHMTDILNYILPDMFGGLITQVVWNNGWIFAAAIAVLTIYFSFRSFARHSTVKIAERLRRLVMKAVSS